MAAEIAAVRAASPDRFGVNLFVPGLPSTEAESITGYVSSLAAHAEAVGAPLGEAMWDDDHLDEKIAILLADPPRWSASPSAAPGRGDRGPVRRRLPGRGDGDRSERGRDRGGRRRRRACVQGSEAGGHWGTFANDSATGEGHR